jgi:hypothetical protein
MTARPGPAAAAVSALLLLAACSPPPQTAASRASQATVTACRERAEDVYVSQNRDLLYQNDTSTTPYSAGPNTGIPTHGLASLFAHQRTVDDCIRNTGTETQRNDTQETTEPGGQGAPTP